MFVNAIKIKAKDKYNQATDRELITFNLLHLVLRLKNFPLRLPAGSSKENPWKDEKRNHAICKFLNSISVKIM